MSIVLPDWVAHISTDAEDKDKKKPTTIFSLSVSPDGSRLATGGIDQKVRIWATEPMLDEKVEKMQGAHRLLSTLSRHTGESGGVDLRPAGTLHRLSSRPYSTVRLRRVGTLLTIRTIPRNWIRRHSLLDLGI